MFETVLVLKDEKNQQAIPMTWRAALSSMVEAIQADNFELLNNIEGIRSISKEGANRIQDNIEDYGCQLTCLSDATWNTSVCQWMNGYWEVLLDLCTVEEGLSDLALSLRVYEKGQGFEFEIISVHVP